MLFTARDRELKKRWLRYFVAFRGLSLLPERIAYWFASRLGDWDSRQENDWAAAFSRGLRLAFPLQTESFIAGSVQAHFRMMAREVLDVFYLPRRRVAHLGSVFFPSGFEILKRPEMDGRGTIIAMAHYGRPIMLSTALGLSGYRIGMLSQAVDERNTALNQVEQRYLQYKMRHTVAQAGGSWITTMGSMRRLYEALNRGETIIIMLDVFEPDPAKRFQAPFLGGILEIPTGIIRVAKKTGARLVYGVARELGRTVAPELRPLPDDPEAALAVAVRELEKDVLEAPWQWWQWRQFEHVWRPGQ